MSQHDSHNKYEVVDQQDENANWWMNCDKWYIQEMKEMDPILLPIYQVSYIHLVSPTEIGLVEEAQDCGLVDCSISKSCE